MPLQPVRRDFNLSTAVAPDKLADRVTELLQELTRRPTTNARSGSVQTGSRVAYRLFGGVMSAGKKRLPMIVRWSITDNKAGSDLHLEMKSDEGSYAFATKWHHQAYEQRFAQLEKDVRSRLT